MAEFSKQVSVSGLLATEAAHAAKEFLQLTANEAIENFLEELTTQAPAPAIKEGHFQIRISFFEKTSLHDARQA
jgi:hypothetical protein